jgi:3-isopropylmalate/(R)-2-methylmalate dehydratase large subunit
MAMTASEKILARASGLASVRPGDVVHPRPDWVFLHDLQVPTTKRELDTLGIDRVSDPDRVVFVSDHEVLYSSPAMIARGATIRVAAKAWGIKHFYDVGQGGHGHIFPIEDGMIQPGMLIFANDMHCTNFGAAGAFGFRVGMEVSSVLAMGTVWTLVPNSIRLTLTGVRPPGVYGRDVGFRVSRHLANGDFGVDIVYRVLELAGPALEYFDLEQRVAITNTPTEISAIGVFIPPSAQVLEQLSRAAGRQVEGVYSDPDAEYEADITFDIGSMQPQVALPGAPESAVDVSEVTGRRVDHAFIGSCGSGMYEDMLTAASYLRGRHIAPGTRLFVVPGTVKTAQRLANEGLLQVFQDAGAIILPSGCGPCSGGSMGPLGSGERSISTAAVNTHGRMGAKDAEIFLGSPATVAASALAGAIADCRLTPPAPLQQAA